MELEKGYSVPQNNRSLKLKAKCKLASSENLNALFSIREVQVDFTATTEQKINRRVTPVGTFEVYGALCMFIMQVLASQLHFLASQLHKNRGHVLLSCPIVHSLYCAATFSRFLNNLIGQSGWFGTSYI